MNGVWVLIREKGWQQIGVIGDHGIGDLVWERGRGGFMQQQLLVQETAHWCKEMLHQEHQFSRQDIGSGGAKDRDIFLALHSLWKKLLSFSLLPLLTYAQLIFITVRTVSSKAFWVILKRFLLFILCQLSSEVFPKLNPHLNKTNKGICIWRKYDV